MVIIPFYPELPSLVLVALTVLFGLAVVALFHSAYNSAWGTGDHKFTGELISGPTTTLIPIGAVAVVAVVVAVLSRGRLAYEPERGTTTERRGWSGSNEAQQPTS